MEEFKATLEESLKQSFPGCDPQLEIVEPMEKIGGVLVWQGFEGLPQHERQARLWAFLRQSLDLLDQMRVTAILTVTPLEMAALLEGVA
jgi:hypothetical protein